MKRNGYTLSEVLITLGIIGVIAAISIPSLINEYNKQIYAKTLQVAISDFEAAMKAMMMKEGVFSILETEAWKSTFSQNQYKLDNYSNANTIKNFASHINKVLPIKQTNVREGLLQGLKNGFFSNPGVGLITNKNVEYFIKINHGTYNKSEKDQIESGDVMDGCVGYLIIDVNAEAKPNRRGRDCFRYFISKDGYLFPDYQDMNLSLAKIKEICLDTGDGCSEYLRQNNYKMDY